MTAPHTPTTNTQSGNVLFMILLAIVLIGLLTAALQSGGNTETAEIDDETLSIRAGDVQRAAGEFERAVKFILETGKSETDLRFAHPEASSDYGAITTQPTAQIFDKTGGGASYRAPPDDINDGSAWEFFGGTAVPGMGTAKADLVAVLPNVTQQFCEKINALNGQSGQPLDTGSTPSSGTTTAGNCVMMTSVGRFNDGSGDNFYTTPNTMDAASFAQDPNTSAVRPAPQACVRCDIGTAYHVYHVLLAR